MYHPSKGLHVHCVSSGCQLDTATASVRFFTLHSSLFTFHFSLTRKSHCVRRVTGGYPQEHKRKKSKKP